MKLPSLVTALVISTLAPAFAITEADITPAALVGKTLTFTIVNGGSPYPTTGTWSGTFAASGNAFTVANITGDTVPISTTFSAVIDGMFTDVSLGKFVEGQAPAKLSLFILAGIPKYEVVITGVFGVSLNGTFTIGSSTVNSPEINVLNDGIKLADGTAKVNLGRVKIGKTSTEKFVIKNTGKSKLTSLAITKNGTNKADFILGALPKTNLAAGASMTVTVTFKPGSKGKKAAAIHLKSNDADENPFDIKLAGEGVK